MAQVIQFTPRKTSPSGLLRAARERSGMSPEEFARHLGEFIGRPQLSPGAVGGRRVRLLWLDQLGGERG